MALIERMEMDSGCAAVRYNAVKRGAKMALADLERARPVERNIEDIADKVFAGDRLTAEEGLRLFQYPNLPELAFLANHVRERLHPETNDIVTFNIGRNINYTNVCWVRCKFCAFYRVPGHEEGYTLTDEQIIEKCRELVELGGREILIQGGLNPKLKIDYYERLFRAIKAAHPTIDIHGLS